MAKPNVCLFTAHSPIRGGGGAILRSLIGNLPTVSVTWYYTYKKAEEGYEGGYLGPGIMGGNILNDLTSTFKMLSRMDDAGVNRLVDKLLTIPCDVYWIVSHNEGIRVALELALRQQQRPVHLTVHDDWGGALAAQSFRYRLFKTLANQLTVKVLQAVCSFDVVSYGMQNYYKNISGIKGEVCHRFLSSQFIKFKTFESGTRVNIGHIGRLYKKNSLIKLIKLLKNFYEPKGITPLVKLWGCHINSDALPKSLRAYVCFYPTASEEEVIRQLVACDILYAMYPLEKRLEVFAQTSLPTKLSSYLQAGRPILAHCAPDSTLAEYINTTGLGLVWKSDSDAEGMKILQKLSVLSVTEQKVLSARDRYFGERNLEVINSYLVPRTQTMKI
ncbi:hypothetical protein [Mucilaginibacter sp. HD30]